MRRIDDRRVNSDTRMRRRAGHDMPAPGDLGRRDRHDRAGHVAVPSARNVAACCFDGNGLLPRDQTGHDLDLDFLQAGLLRLGEPADIFMGKPDVAPQLF